jgi:hypothetical protein
VTSGAQNFIHEYPWNPDSNNDNFVGTQDLTGFLSAFGSEFGNPPEPCDYDGTALEVFLLNLISGDVVLDSMFVEFQIQDVSSYYVPGCPDLLTDTVTLTEAGYLDVVGMSGCSGGSWGDILWSVSGPTSTSDFSFTIHYFAATNEFQIGLSTFAHFPFVADGFFPVSSCGATTNHTLPFPESWQFSETGIYLDGWTNSSWMNYANYIHLLPYWHYAD